MIRLDAVSLHRLANVGDLVEALREAFKSGAVAPPRSHYSLQNGPNAPTLLVMPSWREGGATGVKLVTVFPNNPARGLPTITGEYILFNGETGQTLALIDGPALTALRTAAVSALAADILAPPDARTLLMIGSGALAPHLIEGHMSVRDYEDVMLWARDLKKANALAARLSTRGVTVQVVEDLDGAVRQADVVSCATMTSTPIVHGAWLKSTAHLDLVGGFLPTMREGDDACVRNALVAVDTMDAVKECGDLMEPLRDGLIDLDKIVSLTTLVRSSFCLQARHHSVFKSVGYALADLAAAEHFFELSSQSIGREQRADVPMIGR